MPKQPTRDDRDGAINVTNNDDGTITLSCETDGERTLVRMGPFNAWRAFGMLAVMLGISLPAKLARSIKL